MRFTLMLGMGGHEDHMEIARMSALTHKIRFYPGVLEVPVRQPLVLVKTISSLALLSGNRFSLGAGLSP
jgi:alkanesulfonate monooxygenase SsuD/methylene tetrahydromethanopterin reductase-like flavin-dependent oxidoreductase (luciferase family)